jgi:glycosyl transferase, family 25
MIFRSLHDFHDHRYVLTTARNVERQALLRAELPGWDLALFGGVDRRDSSKGQLQADGVYDEAAAIAIDRSGRTMTAGAICCALGHRRIYEDFLHSAYQRVLIFEDDVRAIRGSDALVDEMVRTAPRDAELIYWGWIGVAARPWFAPLKQALYHVQHSAGLLKYNHTMINNLYPRRYNQHFAGAGKQFCAHAYSLTRSGAEKLIRWQTPITLNADNAMMYAILNGELRAYIALTKVFGQASLDTQSGIPSLTQS